MQTRPLKFRIWDIQNQCWMRRCGEPFGWIASANVPDSIYPMPLEHFIERPQYWTVQQFTGFKDMMDREIYEGDVLRMSAGPDNDGKYSTWLGLVIFDTSFGQWKIRTAMDWNRYTMSSINLVGKVTGNICESRILKLTFNQD